MSDPRGYWNLVFAEDPAIDSTEFFHAAYGGGRWVVVGKAIVESDVGDVSGLVATAAQPDDDWSSQIISAVGPILTAAYGDGLWVAGGYASGDELTPTIFTATNPAGTWTQRSLPDPLRVFSAWITSIAFDGSRWAAAGYDGTIYATTNPTSSWSTVSDILDSVAGGVSAFAYLAYVNSRWVAVSFDVYETAYRIFSASDPSGPWAIETTIDFTSYSEEPIRAIWFANGTYYISMQRFIWSSDSLDGTWTLRHYGTPIMARGANYGDGDIVTAEYVPKVATAAEGPYEEADGMDDPNNDDSSFLNHVAFDGDEWVGVGRTVVDYEVFRGAIWSPAGGGGTGWGLTL